MSLPRPEAVLFDYGGVLVDAPSLPSAPPALVERLVELTGGAVTAADVVQDLAAGVLAYARWRDDAGPAPAELTHAEVWSTFMTGSWPAAARSAVAREATPLSYTWTWRPDWAVRPGIPAVLAAIGSAGLPMAVVSNTLCGAAHRDFLGRAGLGGHFGAQLYSDESGVRKPNPELALRAARELGVPIDRCWFVGDSPRRDVACARGAGVAAMVLMRSSRTAAEEDPALGPDAVVDDGHGLLALLA